MRIDATKLIPGLYIGSAPKTGPGVAKAGFDVLVLCAEEYQPRSAAFPGLKTLVHAPMDDDLVTAHLLDTVMMAALEIADQVHNGRRVLVTCMAGRNRSGLVSAVALHFITCWSPGRCAYYVRQKRQGIGGAALSNPHFYAALEQMPQIAC